MTRRALLGLVSSFWLWCLPAAGEQDAEMEIAQRRHAAWLKHEFDRKTRDFTEAWNLWADSYQRGTMNYDKAREAAKRFRTLEGDPGWPKPK